MVAYAITGQTHKIMLKYIHCTCLYNVFVSTKYERDCMELAVLADISIYQARSTVSVDRDYIYIMFLSHFSIYIYVYIYIYIYIYIEMQVHV